jgi:hypothetical protein
MFVTGIHQCDFVVCTICHGDSGLFIQRIAFDYIYFNTLLHKLEIFYMKCVVPLILSEDKENRDENSWIDIIIGPE